MPTLKRLSRTMPVTMLALALAAVGCSAAPTSAGTSSGSSGTGSSGGSSGSSGTSGSVDASTVNVAEVEPNDGPDAAHAQDLGKLAASETIVIKGELASGGSDGTKYTGDWDLFTFDATDAGALDVHVDWTSGADVDLAVYDGSYKQLGADGATTKPAAVKIASASGKMVVALFSKDLAAPYTLTIGYTKAATGGTTTPSGGTCPTTPIVAAVHTGGCDIDTTSPVCAVADLRNGGSFELDWTTHQTFCEGPHTILVTGDPPSDANSVTFSITSSYSGNDASMTRNIGGFMKITAKDIAPLTSTTGVYYYGVGSFGGSKSEGRAFTVIK